MSTSIPEYALRGHVCARDCVGYCTCEPCIACGEMGGWTNFIEDKDGKLIGSECDECWREDNPELFEDDDEDEGVR